MCKTTGAAARESHSVEFAMLGSRRLHFALMGKPFLFALGVGTVAKFHSNGFSM